MMPISLNTQPIPQTSLQSAFFFVPGYEAKMLYLETMDKEKDASEYLSESCPAG